MASGSPNILDLDELILSHAKDLFEISEKKDLEKKWGCKFEWEKLKKQVRKERLVVETTEVKYKDKFTPASDAPVGVSMNGQMGEGGIAIPKHRSLFKTVYENTTNIEQKYTMSTERSTTQSVSMNFSKCMHKLLFETNNFLILA